MQKYFELKGNDSNVSVVIHTEKIDNWDRN